MGHWGQETEWHTPKLHENTRIGNIRAVEFLQPWLMGLAYGAEVYEIEGFSRDGPTWPYAIGWSPKRKEFGHVWTRALKPFLGDVLKHGMIPTREQVRQQIRVAFHPPARIAISQARKVEHYPYDIFNAVHGISSHWFQWVPDETRYYLVPMLPVLATDSELAHYRDVVDPFEFASTEEAINYMNLWYPATPNEAFAVLSGDTGVITNSEEIPGEIHHAGRTWHPRASHRQHFFLRFTRGPVHVIEGEVEYRQYFITRQYPDRMFMHVNNFQDKESTFTLEADHELAVKVRPESALVSSRPEDGGQRLTLTVGHGHEAGAVRITAR